MDKSEKMGIKLENIGYSDTYVGMEYKGSNIHLLFHADNMKYKKGRYDKGGKQIKFEEWTFIRHKERAFIIFKDKHETSLIVDNPLRILIKINISEKLLGDIIDNFKKWEKEAD